MTNTRGKKTAVPTLKKQKGPGATSSSTSTEARHPLLRFSLSPQDDLFQLLRVRPLGVGRCIDWTALEQVRLANEVRAFITTAPWDQFFLIIEPTYLELTLEFCTTFHLQYVMNTHDEAMRHMSVPEFGIVLGIYIDEFISVGNFLQLNRHIHYSPSYCWIDLTASQIRYDMSRSKASALAPALRYLHALLAHTLTGRRESIGVINTHDAYFLWSRRQVTQSSSLMLIGQMSPQGIQRGPTFSATTESPTSSWAASLSEVSDHLHHFEQ
ncbi:hypothetical protein PVK06_043541 [Gossypium arboreum]|uniref:Arabidopsis retrotransposon Orf1 C-terminal domain-containing protein n=1 Tax=Gossypium arboreum TaxID=29729 RepID=A0ABR0MNZ4_GOSAR|nr:hypothetical protein PVK06_043541 [Gossypium arboreum]